MAMSRARLARQKRRNLSRTRSPDKSFKGVAAATAGFLGVIMILLLASQLSLPSEKSYSKEKEKVFEFPEEIPPDLLLQLDAVLVLGGGVPTSLDVPLVDVQRRCDDAAKVVNKRKVLESTLRSRRGKDLPILCLSAGTKHLPQLLSADGLPIWESTSCAAYLDVKHGINTNVYVETTSYDTIGNAFFARVSHTDITGWRNLLVITNEFHMDRTKAIFEWIFNVDRRGYRLSFLASPNTGLDEAVLEARREKESKSLESIAVMNQRYQTLHQVWSFMNEAHGMYAASKLVERGRKNDVSHDASELARKSYGQ